MKSASSSDDRPSGLFVGLAAVDVSYTVDEIPRRNQKVSVKGQLIAPGGPATNAATTFAFLGGRTALVTAVGAHAMASVIRDDLAHSSIRLRDIGRGRLEPPPISSILIHRATGERTVISANAAVFSPINAEFNPRWLAGVSVVLVDGQYMPLCIASAKAARERGIPVVLDCGSWKPGMAGLLPLLDTAICSGDFRPPGCRSEDDVFEFLAKRKIPRLAITRGDSAIRLVENGRCGEIPIRRIRPVDTLGAGDIFHGAFCFYACQPRQTFRSALAAASRVATFSCRFPGTRSWMERFQG